MSIFLAPVMMVLALALTDLPFAWASYAAVLVGYVSGLLMRYDVGEFQRDQKPDDPR